MIFHLLHFIYFLPNNRPFINHVEILGVQRLSTLHTKTCFFSMDKVAEEWGDLWMVPKLFILIQIFSKQTRKKYGNMEFEIIWFVM